MQIEDLSYLRSRLHSMRTSTLLFSLSLFSIATVVSAASEPMACTMDAKLCPDGVTYVGRDGNNNCAWQQCPAIQPCTKEECGPAIMAPNYICADGSMGGPVCSRDANGVCAYRMVQCPIESSDCDHRYLCNDGTTIARCTDDGHMINYFAAPCLTHGGEIGESPASFSDVPDSHANAEAIAYVKAQGIVEGYADGTYHPDQSINRAEFTKIIMKASIPFDTDCYGGTPFSDVHPTDWFLVYVCLAHKSGIVAGYPDGTFRPTANINFAESAKIIAGVFAVTPERIDLPTPRSGDPWYAHFVQYLEKSHAIPMTITRFDQSITRGEMAEMIFRLKTGNTDKPSRTYEDLNVREAKSEVTGLPFSFSYPAIWGQLEEYPLDASYGYRLWQFSGLRGTPFSVDISVTEKISGKQFYTTGPFEGSEPDMDFDTYRAWLTMNRTTDGNISLSQQDRYSAEGGVFQRIATFFAGDNVVTISGSAYFLIYDNEYDRRLRAGESPSLSEIVFEDITQQDKHPMDTVFDLYPHETTAEQRFFSQTDVMIGSIR